MGSVKEIVKMKGSAEELKLAVTQMHEQFSTTGKDLIHVLTDLDTLQEERENTRRVLDAAMHCRDISELMVMASRQIKSDDHYGAMHTIEKIQQEQNRVAVTPLNSLLSSWLPVVSGQILDGAKLAADVFLSEVRSNASLFGSTVLRRQAILCTIESKRMAVRSGGSNGGTSSQGSNISL